MVELNNYIDEIRRKKIDRCLEHSREIHDDSMVSIVVPVFNSSPFLPKLIESVKSQSYLNLELILVDDGSTDRSGDICDEYAELDDRIWVIHKNNGGCSEARNFGLKIASGKYLTFIDGDDWISSDYIEYLVRLIKEYKCEMSMSDCVFTTDDMRQNRKDNIRIMTPEEAICCIFYVHTPVGAWNKMYTLETIRKNNISFDIPWFGEGLYFSSMGAQYSNCIAVGHRKIYIYRKNNPNSGTTIRKVTDGINALNNSIFVKNKIRINSNEIDNATNWHIWKNHYVLLMYVIGANSKEEYRDEYKRAIYGIKHMGGRALLHSKVSIKEKVIIVATIICPTIVAKCSLKYKEYIFKKHLDDSEE